MQYVLCSTFFVELQHLVEQLDDADVNAVSGLLHVLDFKERGVDVDLRQHLCHLRQGLGEVSDEFLMVLKKLRQSQYVRTEILLNLTYHQQYSDRPPGSTRILGSLRHDGIEDRHEPAHGGGQSTKPLSCLAA